MGRHRRSAKRAVRPVRTGLLGASAAMAVGAVAVASGLLPGGDTFTVSGERTPGGPIRTDGSATLQTQGRQSDEPTRSEGSPTASESARTPSSSPSGAAGASPSAKKTERKTTRPVRTEAGSKERTATPRTATKAPERTASRAPEPKEERSASATPAPRPPTTAPKPPVTGSPTAAENQVLALVNEERAKVGCAPVRFDADLAELAGDFSRDMAARGFFSHTDPDGDTPWDRAEQAGVKNLGGENIARGQADAAAVMDAWMNSEGHRANILNCDYKTLGVGVHTAPGGPWWTQNFGF
ncbi:CAP domain-containing protein [Streptomyces sp. NPDC000594]|uniref:CAP domain-containing protein n=1 Tax=Streptomyces sp. NPDC000594 TaxID=3154261 RepID=UPI00331E87F5